MYSARGSPGITLVGLPHSGISGSTPACGSPELIAANHALLRLSTPRHPPCALSSLTINRSPAHCLPAYGLKTRVQLKRTEPTLLPIVGRIDSPRRDYRHQDASRIRTCCFRVFVRTIQFSETGHYGGNGTRTRDPRLAKPMLYQLSYSPGLTASGPG